MPEPDDATESVAEYSFLSCNHQSTCMPQLQVTVTSYLHAPVTCMPQLQLCLASLVPNVLARRDEGSSKPCAVDQASKNIGTHSGFEPGTSGSTVQNSNHYTTITCVAHMYGKPSHPVLNTILLFAWKILFILNLTNEKHCYCSELVVDVSARWIITVHGLIIASGKWTKSFSYCLP